jgi:hypothetical protein
MSPYCLVKRDREPVVKIPMKNLDLCNDSSVEWAQGSVGDPKSMPVQKSNISSRQIYSKCLDAFKPTDSTQWVFWRLLVYIVLTSLD